MSDGEKAKLEKASVEPIFLAYASGYEGGRISFSALSSGHIEMEIC